MNPEVKKQWTDALRSGEYEQGRGALRSGDTYCCLGVLCELAVKEGVAIQDRMFYGSPLNFHLDREALTLPLVVMEWAGLNSSSPSVPAEGHASGRETVALAELNDNYGANFERIADVIQEHL